MYTFNRLLSVTLIGFLFASSSAIAGDQTPDWVPNGFSLAYAQNFSSPDSIDDFVFSSPGDWSIVQVENRSALQQNTDGEKYKPPHRSPHHIGLIKQYQFGSFILDAHVQQIGKSYGHRDACIFFNFSDPAHFYYTHIGAKRDDVSHQIHVVDGSPRTAITRNKDQEAGLDWDEQKWHHIRLIRNAKKGQIALYVNDMSEPEMVAKDTTHQFGYVGFGSFDDKARFTNIRIWAPNTKKKTADFFSGK